MHLPRHQPNSAVGHTCFTGAAGIGSENGAPRMASTTRQARPATVTVAATLMTLTAFGYLITALALFGQVGRARQGVRDLLDEAGMDGGGMAVFLQSAVVLTAVLTIVAALILLGAAAGVRSGNQAARIVAWATMGLLLLCGISGATRSGSPEFSGNVQITMSRSDGTRTRTVADALPTLYSDAYRIGSGIFAVLAMIALVTAAVLLTRSSANRWFAPADRPSGPPPAGYAPPAQYGGPQSAPPNASAPPYASAPTWSRPVEGPGSRAAADAELALLVRQHQRGQLSDAEFAAARARLTRP